MRETLLAGRPCELVQEGMSARMRRTCTRTVITALSIAGCSSTPGGASPPLPVDAAIVAVADAQVGDIDAPAHSDGLPADAGFPDAGPHFDARHYVDAPPADPGPAKTATVRTIDLASNDLVFDASRDVIYSSVPSSVGASGNSIATIDPQTGLVVDTLFVGSEPGPLAISDDFSTLYVSLLGAYSVRRVDLTTRTLDEPISMEPDPISGTRYAIALAVMPGAPHTFAVVRYSP